MAHRPRHPRPDLEKLLRDAEANGWRVEKARKYFKAWCPCLSKAHKETIHITPSTSNYARNKRNKMSKCDEWKEGR